MGFDDVRGRRQGLARILMLREEQIILGGNTGRARHDADAIAPASTSGGSRRGGQTLSVICVALDARRLSSTARSRAASGAITRTNADGSTDTFGGGAAGKSANADGVVSSGTSGSIAATVAPVTGAVGYAWFWGTAGSEVLGAITTINRLITAAGRHANRGVARRPTTARTRWSSTGC